MNHQSSIKSAVVNELFRIGCFLLYYITLIGIGVAILLGAYWVSCYLILDILFKLPVVQLIILGIMAVVGICLLALMLGIYLIKPLFSFSRNIKNTRIEVFESECPELFAMIKKLAKQTQCKMPKHVYLSPDVNACVFYDMSFWSIFFPIRKNLEIGLGLFDGTSVDEVKSVIAHEFGHFSQNSMKIGSTVYVTNTILHNLIFTDDSFWDRWLDKWCMSDTGIIRYFGELTRALTNLIKRLTVCVYRFVQKGYLKLSRYMEYDADSIACRCMGSNVFISSLCKIEVLTNKDNLYRQMLKSLIDEQKMISNYFVGKDIVSKHIPNKEIPSFTFDCEFKNPVRVYSTDSRVKLENIWASHPSLEERITNAKAVNATLGSISKPISSWALIPLEISEKVSTRFNSIIRNNVQEPLSCISDEQFAEWVSNEIKENFMDERLRPFFGETVFEFDLEHVADAPLKSPFSEENAMQIAEFIARIEDWRLLNQVKNKEVDAKEIQLDGVVYKRKDIPFEKVKMELDMIHEKVVKIYSDIYAYVRSKCAKDESDAYKSAFAALFYAEYLGRDLFPQLFISRNNLLKELNRATRREEDEYDRLCSWVRDYEHHLKKVIAKLDLDWIAAFIDEEYIKNLKEYMNSDDHNPRFYIHTEAINEMFHITDSLSKVQRMIYGKNIRIICDIIVSVLDK